MARKAGPSCRLIRHPKIADRTGRPLVLRDDIPHSSLFGTTVVPAAIRWNCARPACRRAVLLNACFGVAARMVLQIHSPVANHRSWYDAASLPLVDIGRPQCAGRKTSSLKEHQRSVGRTPDSSGRQSPTTHSTRGTPAPQLSRMYWRVGLRKHGPSYVYSRSRHCAWEMTPIFCNGDRSPGKRVAHNFVCARRCLPNRSAFLWATI